MDKSQQAASIFNKLANLYESKFMDVSLYHETFDIFCNNIAKENAEVLELACGPGNITKYLIEKQPGFKIFGIDLAPNMIELARQHNPSGEFEVMDCRDILQLGKKYDAIMCGFCLPYLSKEEAIQLIKNAGSLLNPGGIIYISTMEDQNINSGFKAGSTGDLMFMNYHEGAYLVEALEENKFKLIDLQRKDYPQPGGKPTIDLIIIARK